jgi:hypothetical protein
MLAFWQLEDVGPETLGDVVILILTLIPLGIGVTAIKVGVTRWNGYGHLLSLLFIISGGVACAYFLAIYFGWTKVGEGSAVRRVLKAHEVLSQPFRRTVGRVTLLLLGIIFTLGCVALLIFGGWQLIQGSIIIGLGCWLGGLFVVAGLHWPPANRNPLWLCYSKLKERKDDSEPKERGADLHLSGRR